MLTGKLGEISRRRSAIAGDGNLSPVGAAHTIDTCIKCNDGATFVSLKMRAMAVEAILRVVYLDSSDFEVVRRRGVALGM